MKNFFEIPAVAMLAPLVFASSATRNVKASYDEGVLVRDVANDMVLLEPDTTPLMVLTTNTKRKQPCKAPKFEWIEDAEVSFWAQAGGSGDYTSASTSIAVADITLFAVGDIVAVPKAVSSSAAEEVILVTAVTGTTTGTITVTRNIGGAGADTISATGSLRIIGGAFLENSTIPSGRYSTKVNKYSYAQIFRTVVDVSETERSTELYGSPEGEEKFQIAKAMVRHKSEIEGAGWFSRASETTGAQSRWTTQGFKATVSDNVTDAGTTLTITKMNDFSETAFRYGETKKLFVAAPKILSALNYFAQNKLFVTSQEKVFGVNLQKFVTPHGELLLARNFRMENGISGLNGFADEAFCVDLPSVALRYLAGNGKSRDTKLYSDIVKDGTDGVKSEVKSQIGWQFRHGKRHSRIYDCTAYA